MKKKYVIELESGTHMFVFGPEGIVHIGEPDVVYKTVDGMEIGNAVINAKPYTEPDMEKAREEAYQQGLFDAKEGKATCQYCEYQYLDDTEEPCKKCCKAYMNKYKPKAKEQQIQVGDVVRVKNAPEIEIWVTGISDEDGGLLSGLALKTVDDNCDMGDIYANRNIHNFERTGKHYDMPTVLEKMRGETDSKPKSKRQSKQIPGQMSLF